MARALPPESGDRTRPQSIAVFGGGTVAMLAAVALARALPGTRIVRVSTPLRPGSFADLAHSAHPGLARLHERIGLREVDLLRHAQATHRLAIRYDGWRRDGRSWLVGHGAAADPVLAGLLVDRPGTIALGGSAAIAAADRFAPPAHDAASPLSDIDYALRFDPMRYRQGLTALAGQLRIEQRQGDPVAVARHASGMIATVVLGDGETIAADLFIDATGPDPRLFALAGLDQSIDWTEMLPVDSVLSASTLAPTAVHSFDTITALPEGWIFSSPGRDGTRIGLGFNTTLTSTDAAGNALRKATGCAPGVIEPVAARRLAEPFQHNLIALGDAAACFEPLGWCNLHLATASIELLLDLLPGDPVEPLERTEYNRRWGMLADRVRDYVAAPYAAPVRPKSAFWKAAAACKRSPGLTLTLSEYARRSRLPLFEEESIPRDLWVQLLAGSGAKRGPSPRANTMTERERDATVATHIRRMTAAVAASHPYAPWFAQHLENRA